MISERDGTPNVQSAGTSDSRRITVMLLKSRRTIALLSVGLPVLFVLLGLVRSRTYTAQAAFLPQGQGNTLSRFAGLAAQLGVAIPAGSPGESPDFYVELVRSRRMLSALVEHPLPSAGSDAPGNLVAKYGGSTGSTERRRERAIRRLARDVSMSSGTKTGIVRVQVRADAPELAEELTLQMLNLVNVFNGETRRTQAGEERRFIEARLAEGRDQLAQAEERTRRFRERNRGDLRSSPELQLEAERMARDVGLRQQLVTSLAQAFEQARIEEVRNTPVITIVDEPEAPVLPDRRYLAIRALAGLLTGFGLGVVVVVARRALATDRRETGTDELPELWREFQSEVRRPWRLVGLRGSR